MFTGVQRGHSYKYFDRGAFVYRRTFRKPSDNVRNVTSLCSKQLTVGQMGYFSAQVRFSELFITYLKHF